MDLLYQRQDLTKIQVGTLPQFDKGSCSEGIKGGVGTGLSCGVDSFHAVLKHLNSGYPSQDLTHLATFEVGGVHGLYQNPALVRQKIFERAEKVSRELKLPLVKLKSNLQHVIWMDNLYHHTYRDVMAVYAMQKLWKTYYYASSAYGFNYFTLKKCFSIDPAYFELLLLDCFSIEGLRLISAGGEGDRTDKIEFIADKPLAQKYLHVCINREINCGVCEKCLRTLLIIDAVNKLDNFREVFDIDAYLKIREQAWIYCHDKASLPHNASMYARTYKTLYAQHKEFFDSITPATKRMFKAG